MGYRVHWLMGQADMKRTFTSLLLGVALLVGGGGVGLAQDFDAGVAAYNRGDYATAFRVWIALAAKGDAVAQYNVGVSCDQGRGVTQDYVYAHMWFNIAETSGDADAVNNRDIEARKMTAAQIARAQELARQCVAKNYKGW